MDDLGKVCVVLSLDGEYGVFLVDLNQARLDYGVNAGKFFEIKPNLTIPDQDRTITFIYHVLSGSLYAFNYKISPEHEWHIPLNLQVYSIDLSSINGAELDFTSFEKCASPLGLKLMPKAVGYNGNLLLFSSEIGFRYMNLISSGGGSYDDSLNDSVDFEVYDPKGRDSRKLPQLHVCHRDEDTYSSALRLYNSAKSRYFEKEFYDITEGEGGGSMYFCIVSYCVDGDDFVVQTDFGGIFCLKLNSGDGDDGWRLCEEFYVFESDGLNIVTPDGVCFNAFGSNDHRRRWLRSIQCQERRDEKGQKMDHGCEAGCVEA